VFVDGGTDLLPFTYSGTAGIMLNQHASAYDLSRSGGISGQLTLTNITTGASGLPAIEVNAEVLSADGTRHVIVNTTSVSSDGSFLLYPLSASTDGDWYDVVIHGPGIATIIIQNVEVTLPETSNSLGSSLTNNSSSTLNSTTSTTTSTSTTSTTTTGTGSVSANNVVAIGTLTPRAATSYNANLATSPLANLPAGTVIDFDQTLGTKGSVPYVIEENPVDPFNQVLFNAQALSTGTVDSGTWSSNGAPVTVVSAAPAQGAGNYIVTPTLPFYAEGALTSQVTAPAGATSTTTTTTTTPTQTFTVPAPSFPSGTASGTLTASVAQVTAGKYDQGELMVSNNGTVVAIASLAQVFAQEGGGSVSVSGLPADTPSSLFYVTVRAWNSSAPDTTLTRQWYPNQIDMRGSASGTIQLTVN
jgi:flagellar basal-body rod modification protein FlgD